MGYHAEYMALPCRAGSIHWWLLGRRVRLRLAGGPQLDGRDVVVVGGLTVSAPREAIRWTCEGWPNDLPHLVGGGAAKPRAARIACRAVHHVSMADESRLRMVEAAVSHYPGGVDRPTTPPLRY